MSMWKDVITLQGITRSYSVNIEQSWHQEWSLLWSLIVNHSYGLSAISIHSYLLGVGSLCHLLIDQTNMVHLAGFKCCKFTMCQVGPGQVGKISVTCCIDTSKTIMRLRFSNGVKLEASHVLCTKKSWKWGVLKYNFERPERWALFRDIHLMFVDSLCEKICTKQYV